MSDDIRRDVEDALVPYVRAKLPAGAWAFLLMAAFAGIVAASLAVWSGQETQQTRDAGVEQNTRLLHRIAVLERQQRDDTAIHRVNTRSDHLCMIEFIQRVVEDVRANTRRSLDEPCPKALPGFNIDAVLDAIEDPAPRDKSR